MLCYIALQYSEVHCIALQGITLHDIAHATLCHAMLCMDLLLCKQLQRTHHPAGFLQAAGNDLTHTHTS